MIGAILAVDDNLGIGYQNGLPWPHNKEDMEHFKRVTEGHVVLMGHNTWKSIGSKPLPNRENVVLSTMYNPQIEDAGGHNVNGHLAWNISCIEERWSNKAIWIIGGKSLYEQARDIIDVLLVSRIKGSYQCDTHMTCSFFDGFDCMSRDEINETLTIVRMEKGYAR